CQFTNHPLVETERMVQTSLYLLSFGVRDKVEDGGVFERGSRVTPQWFVDEKYSSFFIDSQNRIRCVMHQRIPIRERFLQQHLGPAKFRQIDNTQLVKNRLQIQRGHPDLDRLRPVAYEEINLDHMRFRMSSRIGQEVQKSADILFGNKHDKCAAQ